MNSLPIRFLEKDAGFLAALRKRLRGMARGALCVSTLTHALSAGDRNSGSSRSAEWPEYLGDAGRQHSSALKQINTGNVGSLQVAWIYHTGDFGEMQCNPLMVDGTLYGVTAAGGVFALDPTTGKERWRFDPKFE